MHWLVSMTENWKNTPEKSRFVAAVFIDHSKAFGTKDFEKTQLPL